MKNHIHVYIIYIVIMIVIMIIYNVIVIITNYIHDDQIRESNIVNIILNRLEPPTNGLLTVREESIVTQH